MPLQIFNTLTRNKEPYEPIDPAQMRIYVCGPTVYDLSHIGHARVYTAFDTIVRFLRRHYKVTYVRNYTDVDDKIIKRASERNEGPFELSQRYIEAFREDMGQLGIKPADIEPKVTDHVPEIISIIQTLVDKGAAYPANGDVYYAVEKFENYGKLGRRTLEDMEAGARVEVSVQKRHPMDFALWKAVKPGEPSWESPWGPGRPGWHIECSAMAKKYLKETFDIHGGGRDLIFPHHENEIAQSEAANDKPFARCWMHGGLVNIDNTKMSKSLGNFFTVREVLDKFDPQTLRFYLMATHYRSPINFADPSLHDAEDRVIYFYETLQKLKKVLTPGSDAGPYRQPFVEDIIKKFDDAMFDDFNTPQAIGDLSDVFKIINDIVAKPGDADQDARTLRAVDKALKEVGSVLGIFLEEPETVLKRIDGRRQKVRGVNAGEVEKLIQDRTDARVAKDFKKADQIRQQLAKMGVIIKDSPAGTTWHIE